MRVRKPLTRGSIRIARRRVGDGAEPYVIAEVGVNHDGSVERAIELTKLAAQAGANAVKLQVFEARRLMSKASVLAGYQRGAGETDPITMLERLQLSLDDCARVIDAAHEAKIHAIASVFSVELVAPAAKLGWDAFKAASPDIIHRPLLRAMYETGLPLILSTGASTLQEVGRALTWLPGARERVAIMQCVSSYPTPLEMAELPGIAALREIYDGAVGYSDHTSEVTTGALAVIAGACMLEKHFTHDTSAPGPDHAASLTLEQLRKYRSYAVLSQRYEMDPDARKYLDSFLSPTLERAAYRVVLRLRDEASREEKVKRVLDIEQDVRTVSRQSLTTTRALKKGQPVTSDDLTFKRPGTGIAPYMLEATIGRVLARDVDADMPLMEADLAGAGT